MAITASFLAKTGTLSVFGDSLDNTITESRDAAGQILINGGAVSVLGGTPTVANTSLVQIFGQAGNDTITGSFGNDTRVGGAGTDVLVETADVDMTLTSTQLTGGLGTADAGGAWTVAAGASRQAVTGGAAVLTVGPGNNTGSYLGGVHFELTGESIDRGAVP